MLQLVTLPYAAVSLIYMSVDEEWSGAIPERSVASSDATLGLKKPVFRTIHIF